MNFNSPDLSHATGGGVGAVPRLFLPGAHRQSILDALASDPWLRRLFERQQRAADHALVDRAPFLHDVPPRLPDEQQEDRERRWYGESQAVHRGGGDASRLAIVGAVLQRRDYLEAALAQMVKLCDAQTYADSPFQDLVLSSVARPLILGSDLLRDSGLTGVAEVLSQARARLMVIGDWLEYFLIKGGDGARRNHDLIVACQLGLISLTVGGAAPSSWASLTMERIETLLLADTRHLGNNGDWYEGSLRYQFYILQWLHLLADAARNAGWVDIYAEPAIKRFFGALAQFITPDGHNLGFNDTAHDEVIQLGAWALLKGAFEYQDARLYQTLQTVITRQPELPLIPAESFLALNGAAPVPSVVSTEDTAILLDRAGIAVVRSGWSQDASLFALAAGPHSSHHHLSHSTFEYYWRGQPVILETGGGHYVGRRAWVRPEMHNLVVAGNGFQPKYAHPLFGTQGWDFVPRFDGRVTTFLHNETAAFVQADYSLLARIPGAIRNCWFIQPGYLIIEDTLAAPDGQSTDFSSYVHAHGSWKEEAVGRFTLTSAAGAGFRFDLWQPADVSVEAGQHPLARESVGVVMSGGEIRPPSRHLTELEFLKFSMHAPKARFLMSIVPHQMIDTAAPTVVRGSTMEGVTEIDIAVSPTIQDSWLFQEQPRPVRCGALVTDARIAFVRRAEGKPVAWFLLGGRSLGCEEVRLVDSPLVTTFLGQHA
jgi:hypothetical protein